MVLIVKSPQILRIIRSVSKELHWKLKGECTKDQCQNKNSWNILESNRSPNLPKPLNKKPTYIQISENQPENRLQRTVWKREKRKRNDTYDSNNLHGLNESQKIPSFLFFNFLLSEHQRLRNSDSHYPMSDINGNDLLKFSQFF